jgi:hypothetical protein
MTHRLSLQAAALALATILTLAMLGTVDRLATSQAPAGLVAQMAKAPSRA